MINEKRIHKAREDNKHKKFTPLDLRKRRTRVYRKRLTKFELKKKSLR